jgi:hypothetical protein
MSQIVRTGGVFATAGLVAVQDVGERRPAEVVQEPDETALAVAQVVVVPKGMARLQSA